MNAEKIISTVHLNARSDGGNVPIVVDRRSERNAAFARADMESAAIKKWFGDSKVVDADGKPLVV